MSIINEFEIFLVGILIIMPVTKKLSEIFIENIAIKIKLCQYTNWNIVMILANYICNNYFDYNNKIIDKFIAFNSLQIFILFHSFMLYDKRILFEELQGINPFSRSLSLFDNISKRTLMSCEYFIANIILHILPVYYYKDCLVYYNNTELNMYTYLIIFKFIWVLNIIGNFNVTSIYIPKLDICNIKIINIIIFNDIFVDKLLTEISY
uniref:Uncharacterized protein n=1 Tax=Virus NIOZ-UU159 TaxID=2763270 RepID=A0A7S9XHN4_9VIRU|nr:MAG: hypothetical protein NIOZUU159_00322 [Virus NIOZ-UU159]|tara:strand:- start:3224 stop:3847 length:624 start_codon:yes stop_codon:yes gene_type:complete